MFDAEPRSDDELEAQDMAELNELLESVPVEPPTLAGATGRPLRCRRHQWERVVEDGVTTVRCRRCPTVKDEERSRRNRNNRLRGNRLQAKVARAADLTNVGPLGLPVDAGTSVEWLVLQVKSGTGYPRTLDRWLRALTATADQLRGVVYVETPGPGKRAKRMIVLDYDEFLDWFGPNKVIRP